MSAWDDIRSRRAAEKAAARDRDEADLESGAVSAGDLALRHGPVRGVRWVGQCDRIRRLAGDGDV